MEGVTSAAPTTIASGGHTWLRCTIQIFLQKGHGIDHRGGSGRIHEFRGQEIPRGTAEDEQAGCEVEISRILERKENKAEDKISTKVNFRGIRKLM